MDTSIVASTSSADSQHVGDHVEMDATAEAEILPPICTPLAPDVNIRELNMEHLTELLMKLRMKFSQLDWSIRKTSKWEANNPQRAIELERLTLEKEKTFASMQVISSFSGLALFYDPPTPPPTPATVSEQPAPSAPQAEGAQPATGTKRPAEDLSKDSPTNTNDGFINPPKKLIAKTKRKGAKSNDTPIAKPARAQNNDSQNVSTSSMDTTPVPENEKITQNSEGEKKENTFRKNRVPPFFIVPPPHWQAMLTGLRMQAPSLVSKLQGKFLKISVDNEEEHRTLTAFLIKSQVNFKSFMLEGDKPYKCVIRGLPINTNVRDITEELEFNDFEGATVTQMYRGSVSKKKLMPLFHVALPKREKIEEIFNLTELMGTEVTIEVYRGKKGPAQCFRCQGWFHGSNACNLPLKCVKCAGEHASKDCRKRFEEPCKCINCGGDHPANFRSCPKFPKASKKGGKNNKNNKNTTNNQNSKNKNQKPRNNSNSTNMQQMAPRAFDAKKVEATRSFASVVKPASRASPPPPQILM